MGGSGGFFRNTSDNLYEQIRQSEKESVRNSQYETSVNHFLASELAIYNDRNTEKIKSILEKIIQITKNEIETTIDIIFGGSIAKHTYVDGLSDIDALLIIDVGQEDLSPKLLKDKLATILGMHFKRDFIKVGMLAVTLNTEGIELQLLPALKCGKRYKISNARGDDWSQINPEAFTKKLTRTNIALDGKVIPVIKLVKAIVSNLSEKQQISGYHTEALAIKIFKDYTGPHTLKDMVQYFFEKSPSEITKPIQDKTGQSIHVDDDLGEGNSLPRRIITMAFDGINRKLKNADGCQSIELWEKLFRDVEK